LTDRLGTVKAVVNNSAAILNRTTYATFGAILQETNPAESDSFAFTGREYDRETGLYYYRARYYDPGIGRFLSEDPIGFRGGDYHRNRQVTNSPHNFIDPMGTAGVVEYLLNKAKVSIQATSALLFFAGSFLAFTGCRVLPRLAQAAHGQEISPDLFRHTLLENLLILTGSLGWLVNTSTGGALGYTIILTGFSAYLAIDPECKDLLDH
jgi:RHS repeat-associated protein